jgi:hypothetical protein
MRRWISTGVLAAMLATTLPTAALAGSGGRLGSALGLSGLAAYELVNGHTTVGALSAAGAAYGWYRYSQAKKQESRRARMARYYRTRYNSSARPYSRVAGYRSSYSHRGHSSRRHSTAYRSASRGSSGHPSENTYLAGYRAGYRQGAYAAGYQSGYQRGLHASGA